jgi:queuine tRNA-ribosyltransferase
VNADRFKKIQLDDGSFTWVDQLNGQAMHSKLGAWKEAMQIYVESSSFLLESASKPLVIWDVGMGTASNAIAAIESATHPLKIVSFENAPDSIRGCLKDLHSFPFLKKYSSEVEELLKNGRTRVGIHEWEFLEGDFFTNCNRAPLPNFIFWDFYAPQVVPELWSLDAFRAVGEVLKSSQNSVEWVSYASATSIRVALILAGFFVFECKGTEAKKETTQAVFFPPGLNSSQKSLVFQREGRKPLDLDWLEKVRRSSKPFPVGWQGGIDELILKLKDSPHGRKYFV